MSKLPETSEINNYTNQCHYDIRFASALRNVSSAVMLQQLLLLQLKSEGWFRFTVEECKKRTSLSRKEQETAVKVLYEKGLFKKKSFGIPRCRHFLLNSENLQKLMKGGKNV